MSPVVVTQLARHIKGKCPHLSAPEQAALVAKIVRSGDAQVNGNGELWIGSAGREAIESAKPAPKTTASPPGRRYEPSGETLFLLKEKIARERPHLTEAERSALARQIAWSDDAVTVDYSSGKAVLSLPSHAIAALGGSTPGAAPAPTASTKDRDGELAALANATSDRDKIRRATLLEERIKERLGDSYNPTLENP